MKELNLKYEGCNLPKTEFFQTYLKGTLSGLRLFLANGYYEKCFLFHLKRCFRSQDI